MRAASLNKLMCRKLPTFGCRRRLTCNGSACSLLLGYKTTSLFQSRIWANHSKRILEENHFLHQLENHFLHQKENNFRHFLHQLENHFLHQKENHFRHFLHQKENQILHQKEINHQLQWLRKQPMETRSQKMRSHRQREGWRRQRRAALRLRELLNVGQPILANLQKWTPLWNQRRDEKL